MKRYFVSYFYSAENKQGYGSADVTFSKGIFSFNDIKTAIERIKTSQEESLKTDDVNVVILNWRRYEFSLALWIKDIFNKIRGRK